ncbi:MAG: HDOD domain-containing protein [Candidatus Hydrogenedentes bacterium]|nr:HDOD domain-containing protein [Candidatus Hydrogenedentota bacterium]
MSELGKYTVESLLEEIVTLPSLPSTVQRVLSMLSDPNTRLSDLSRIISLDPSISLKLLRLVNSAYYGLGQKVTSIEHAVVLLGTKVVKNLVLTASVFTQLGGKAKKLVLHSIATGIAMDAIASVCPLGEHYSKGDTAFVFGLLHDIGKVILGEYLKKHWECVCKLAEEEKGTWIALEQRVIGVDHAEVGGKISQQWKLSEELWEAVRWHHEPWNASSDKTRTISASLCIADYITRVSGLITHPHKIYPLEPEVWELAGVKNNLLLRILDTYFNNQVFINELVDLTK